MNTRRHCQPVAARRIYPPDGAAPIPLRDSRQAALTDPMKYLAYGLLIAPLLSGCTADWAHHKGMRLLEQGRYEQGLAKLREAADKDPRNVAYRRDLYREQEKTLDRLLRAADGERAAGRLEQAAAGYQLVLRQQPGNARAQAGLIAMERGRRHAVLLKETEKLIKEGQLEAAQARLHPVLLENPAQADALALQSQITTQLQAKSAAAEPALNPRYRKPVSLQFRDANLKMVFDALSRTSGINIMLDKDVRSDIKTTIFVQQTPVEDALELILAQNQLLKKVLNENSILVYPNTPAKVRDYEDLMIRTFYLSNVSAKDTMSMIKTLLKTRDVFIDEKNNLLMMRDTPAAIQLAEKLINAQDLAGSEVMLEVEVLEITRARLSQLGIKYPEQVSASIASPTGGLLTLADFQGLGTNNILISPLSATLDLKKDDSDVNLLASPRIRTRNREKATIHIGDRVPVIINSVTPVATGAPVVTGSVQYLDVGLKLEVEPTVFLDDEVAIATRLEVSNIVREITSPASGTVAFQLGTRSATTVLRLKDGETQVLAGLISDEDRKSASKIPILGDLPVLGRLFSTHRKDKRKTEIVLAITPHLIRNLQRPQAPALEFWSGTEATLRNRPVTTMPASTNQAGSAAPRAALLSSPVQATLVQQPASAAPGTASVVAPPATPAPGTTQSPAPLTPSINAPAPGTGKTETPAVQSRAGG